jgi:3-deoxy-7-phosphoheptulonate synthase
VILLLDEGLSSEQVRVVEQAVRRAGGDPKKLSHEGRVAIDARGADRLSLGRPHGVAMVLAPAPAYPKVAATGNGTRPITIGPAVLGDGSFVLTAGPCAVESREQLFACAAAVRDAGGLLLRGGAFKPRTSPYSFQGHGEDALVLLREAADHHGLGVVTEVMEPGTVGIVAELADALQIGSRNMQNFALLKAVGKTTRPIVLKRGMSATLDEWLLAAEYVADAGNDRIILCERGVRSFDPAARNLLDLAAVPLLRERTSLPIVVDPSHGVGVRSAIPAAARAAAAIGADGVMIEVHPDPGVAMSDGFQALPLGALGPLAKSLMRVHDAVK